MIKFFSSNLFVVFIILISTACTFADSSKPVITSFEECVAAGFPVMRSYPAKCATGDGQIFIDDAVKPNVPAVAKAEKSSFCKDLCGDGTCQELVCMAEGCPCSENPQKCPQDCKN